MQSNTKRENLLYLIVWIVIFTIPVIMCFYKFLTRPEEVLKFSDFVRGWMSLLPYFLLFLIHNYVIYPLFFNRKKWFLYALLTLVTFAAFAYTVSVTHPRPPHRIGPPPHPGEMQMQGKMKPGPAPIDPEVLLIVVGALMLISNVGGKLYFKGRDNEERLQELEKENLNQQLEYLRYQINPHFFMNTLNNIHALVDIDPSQAKKCIVDLSKLMRYLLYEGDKPTIPLSKEIEFLKNYVSLMKVRYSDNVKVELDFPSSTGDKEIAPLLFVSFVENAFKHGISYESPSFIKVKMDVGENDVKFSCSNSIHHAKGDDASGIGLQNVRRRLDLLYPGKYTMDINEDGNTFDVFLKIPETA